MEIFSIYIPKTASTAFKNLLCCVYGEDKVLQVSHFGSPGANDSGWHEDVNRREPDIKVVHGHFSAHRCKEYFPDVKRIVWLREPVTRLISHYFFWRNSEPGGDPLRRGVKNGTVSLEQMAERLANIYTNKYLVGMSLDDFFFVGIQEFFAEDTAELGNIFGWPKKTELDRSDEGTYKSSEEYKKIINDRELMNRLKRINGKDIELYREALRRRDDRLNAGSYFNKARPKILIAGLPKSGTTALYYKIYNSMPGHPRKMFEFPQYDPAPEDDRTGVIAKIVFNPDKPESEEDPSWLQFDKKILIVRDPRDRLVSNLLYRARDARYYNDPEKLGQFLQELRQKEKEPSSKEFITLCLKVAELNGHHSDRASFAKRVLTFKDHLLRFHEKHQDYFLFKYEDMIDGNFAALEEYLGFKLWGEALVPKIYGFVERSKRYGNWRSWFTPNDLIFLKPLLEKFMKKFSYDFEDWRLEEKPVISPAESSEYVRRIVAERIEIDEDLWRTTALRELKITELSSEVNNLKGRINKMERSFIWRTVRLFERVTEKIFKHH